MTAYCEKEEKLAEEFSTDLQRGLSQKEAEKRREKYGANQLESGKEPGLLSRLAGQLFDPMILVLLAAALLSLWASGGEDFLDSVIILVIVVVNAALSISQEDHAQKALRELKAMAAPTALVRREGELRRVPASEVVVGDLLYFEAGDQICADARICSAAGLKVDEAAMTGESVSVEKHPGYLKEDTPLAERVNMVLSGTLVVAGRGWGLVTATGMDTEMGKIAAMLSTGERKTTPLQQKMKEISKALSFLCLSVCGVMFGVGALQGKNLVELFLTAVSLAVAAIPEGLPAIVTIVLAMGVQRLAKRGAIVTKLMAVETLGGASVICSDKTGTLTRNRMDVREVWALSQEAQRRGMMAFALCNDAQLHRGQPSGDPTEAALLEKAERAGLEPEKLRQRWPRVGEVSFDATRKRMSTLHKGPEGLRLFVKGAPDLLLERCDRVWTSGGEKKLTQAMKQAILRENKRMGEKALRVLAAAEKPLKALPRNPDEKLENGLVFLALAGMMDPPREGVKEAVAECYQAGIRPVMITGDHRSTAVAVARELDILRPGQEAVTGEQLDFMDDEMLREEVERIGVFARVTPEHKMRIVQAFQSRGQVVAMTGDGVNDAPALQKADIGCAMGKSGTQVAKSASHLILTDDNFSTIVSAVAEGRGIYANIKKAIHYLLSCNIGEILTIFAATVLDFPQMPLMPVQLLWLNLVTDSLPALALGVEPAQEGQMREKPRGKEEKLFDKAFTFRLVWQGCMVGALTLAAYFLGGWVIFDARVAPRMETANTMAFATLTLTQLFHAFNVRSHETSVFSLGLTSNRAMNRAFLAGIGMQLAVLLVPRLQSLFATVRMTGMQWLTVFGLAALPIGICEVQKFFARKRAK